MAKKKGKKSKFKKILLRLILLVMITCGGFYAYQYLEPRYKLNQVGYEKEEIQAIMALTPEEVETLIEMPKVDKILVWMPLSSQLERYTSYLDVEPVYPELSESEIVEITNLVLDHPDVFVFSKGQSIVDFFKIMTPEFIKDYYNKTDPNTIIQNVDDVTLMVDDGKQFSISYIPANLEPCALESAEGKQWYMVKEANDALREMAKAALKEGYELMDNNSYRSYFYQEEIYQYYLDLYGQAYCNQYVATPGKSEHQTGLAIDLTSRSVQDGPYGVFGDTPDYDWVVENAHEYGFILRFPSDKTEITGTASEPWHFRYVGKEVARVIYENDWCLEEYYANN